MIQSFIRSIIVLILVLGAGGLGLWFLSGKEIVINKSDISNATNSSNSQNSGAGSVAGDIFKEFGGKSPNETLTLLINALEKNNLTLAMKYFSPEIRAVESEELKKLQDANLLGDLAGSLKSIKIGRIMDNSHYRFIVPDETGETIIEIELAKNSADLWKIISF